MSFCCTTTSSTGFEPTTTPCKFGRSTLSDIASSLMFRTPFTRAFGTLFLLVSMQSGFSQSSGSSSSIVTVHRQLDQSCELIQKALLIAEDDFVSLTLDGDTDKLYSPEMGKNDFIAFPAKIEPTLTRMAQKSGFRTRAGSDDKMNDLPKVMVRDRNTDCSSLERVLQQAKQDGDERRHRIQSKVFQAGVHGVKPPEEIDSPVSNSELRGGSLVVSAVVGINGTLEQVKIIRSPSSIDQRKILAAVNKWKFRPGRMDGLPVPVKITVEISSETR